MATPVCLDDAGTGTIVPSQPNHPNLLKRFVDEGDLLLGRALETKTGRELYKKIKNHVFAGARLSVLYDYCVYLDTSNTNVWSVTESADDDKILVLKMIEKAVADFIQKQLLLQS